MTEKSPNPPYAKSFSGHGTFSSLNKLRALFTRRDKFCFLALLLGMIAAALLETFSIGIIPAFISLAITPEKLIQYEPAKEILQFMRVTTSRDILLWGCLILLGIFLIKTLFICLLFYLQAKYIQNRRLDLTRRLFSEYMKASYEFHLQRNSAELFRNTIQEVLEIMVKVLTSLLNITMQGIMMLAILVLLFVVQPVIALVGLAILAIAGGGYIWFVKKKLVSYSHSAQDHRRVLVKIIQQGLGVIKELRVLNREAYFVQALENSMQQLIKAIRYQAVTTKITVPYMEFIAVFGLLCISILMLVQGTTVQELAPTLTLFAVAFVRLKTNIGQIVTGINQFRYGLVSIHPVYNDLMLLESKRNNIIAKASLENHNPDRLHLRNELRLQRIWYRYPGCEQYALKDISITLPKGQTIGLVGQTGSGKTTLVDVMLGLLEPEIGQISVDGKDIRVNLSAWQRSIGYIPQFINLTDDTIRSNVALGVHDHEVNEEQLQTAIRVAQLENFVQSLPKGLDTVIGERGVKLSGGQRQRIGIARALYHQPEVLIMDEATSALDSTTEKAVVASFNLLKKDRTIVMIAHRLTTVQNCDVLYFLKNGRIDSSGTYSALMKHDSEFQSMAEGHKH